MAEKDGPGNPIPAQQSLVLNTWLHDAEGPISVTSEGSQYDGEETAQLLS